MKYTEWLLEKDGSLFTIWAENNKYVETTIGGVGTTLSVYSMGDGYECIGIVIAKLREIEK